MEETCGALVSLTTPRGPVYLVGRWSECEGVDGHHPIGRRFRSVGCVDEMGRPTELRYSTIVASVSVTILLKLRLKLKLDRQHS